MRSRRAGSTSGTSPTGGLVYSAPAVWNGRVYFGSYTGRLYCVSAKTGAVLWTLDTGGEISGSPTVIDGVVYAGTFSHRIVGADARTGRQLFSFPHGEYVAVSGNAGRLLLYGWASRLGRRAPLVEDGAPVAPAQLGVEPGLPRDRGDDSRTSRVPARRRRGRPAVPARRSSTGRSRRNATPSAIDGHAGDDRVARLAPVREVEDGSVGLADLLEDRRAAGNRAARRGLRVRGARLRRIRDHEVVDPVVDRASPVDLDALEDVRVVTDDDVRPGVDRRAGKRALVLRESPLARTRRPCGTRRRRCRPPPQAHGRRPASPRASRSRVR